HAGCCPMSEQPGHCAHTGGAHPVRRAQFRGGGGGHVGGDGGHHHHEPAQHGGFGPGHQRSEPLVGQVQPPRGLGRFHHPARGGRGSHCLYSATTPPRQRSAGAACRFPARGLPIRVTCAPPMGSDSILLLPVRAPGARSGGTSIEPAGWGRRTGAWRTASHLPPRAQAERVSLTRSAVLLGVLPTCTPTASRASFLACAVPEEPETMAPAWPMVLPSGAVKPAT